MPEDTKLFGSVQSQMSERADTLLRAINDIRQDDITALDQFIRESEASLNKLKRFRRMMFDSCSAVGAEKLETKSEARLEPEDSSSLTKLSARDRKFLGLRKKAVIYINQIGKPCGAGELVNQCGIAPSWIRELLNDSWFECVKGKYSITPKAIEEVVQS